MKKTSSPPRSRIWTADTVLLNAVRVGGALKPLYLMFLMDQKTKTITGYAYFERLSSLSLIRLLNIAFYDYAPPDLILADFIHDFDFDTWGPSGHHRCIVTPGPMESSYRGATERTAARFRHFVRVRFGSEAPDYGALLLLTDVFFDGRYPSASEKEVPG